MTPTRADLLFALPQKVARAMLLEGAEAWTQPLRAAGVEIVADGPCDLVVASASQLDRVASTDAPMAILLGKVGRGRLTRAGFVGERFLPMPSLELPSLLLPLDHPRLAAYGLSRLLAPPTRLKALRNRILARAIVLGAKLPGTVTLASRGGAPPLLVGAATDVGMEPSVEWLLMLGRASERGVFHLFAAGGSLPGWVLKFSREPVDPVDTQADAVGLGLVAELGEEIAAHAPTLAGVSRVQERTFVVESAAVGAPLVDVLRTPTAPEQKRQLVDAVAGWLVELGAASLIAAGEATPLAGLDGARALAPTFGVDFDALLAPLDGLPAILAHGDTGLEHVIVDRSAFVVIDWEAARRHDLPFLDLAFFLAQALPVLDGEVDDPRYGRHEAFVRLFRGDSPSSPTLMSWFARACEAWGLSHDTLGPLLSIVWLRIGEAEVRRHLAESWFADPALGPEWSASRR